MPNPHRSKKLVFDPADLDDLIFHPAIGKGVPAYLLRDPVTGEYQDPPNLPSGPSLPREEPSSGSDRAEPQKQPQQKYFQITIKDGKPVASGVYEIDGNLVELPIVGFPPLSEPILDTSTVDHSNLSTVDASNLYTVDNSDLSTVDAYNLSTVDNSDLSTVDAYNLSTVDNSNMSTVDSLNQSAVDTLNLPTVTKPLILWVTEHGELIAQSRVKRICLAQDVLNSAEESVYDTLWAAPAIRSEGSFRIVQVGYDYLSKRTRLVRKTIQRIVAKLIDKDFICIEKSADIYHRTSTAYRVFGYGTVLERQLKNGRTHVAKIGPGFSYAHHLSDPRAGNFADLPLVVNSNLSTVDKEDVSTVEREYRSTVVRESPLLGSKKVGMTEEAFSSPPSPSRSGLVEQVAQAVRLHIRIGDDGVEKALTTADKTLTPGEAAILGRELAETIAKNQKLDNPAGVWITRFPGYATGTILQAHRKLVTEAAERQAADKMVLEQQRAKWQARLEDPKSTEQDKRLAKKILELEGGGN